MIPPQQTISSSSFLPSPTALTAKDKMSEKLNPEPENAGLDFYSW